jgi:hypothetical protein
MGYVLNPFTGKLDAVSTGGSAVITAAVATPADLPITLGVPSIGVTYLAQSSSGTWFVNYKPAGLYRRTANAGAAADWQYLGAFPESNRDDRFRIYNSSDTTKQAAFDVSGISTATTRTLTAPDASGTLALLGNFLGAVKDMVVLAPSADMSVTSNATPADVTGMSFAVAANTSYLVLAFWIIDAGAGGFDVQLALPSYGYGASIANGFGAFHVGNASLPITTLAANTIRLAQRGAAQSTPSSTLGFFRTGSTGGTANVRFSQTSSNGAASVLQTPTRALIIPLT